MDNRNKGRREEQQDLALLLAVFVWKQRGWDGGRRGREIIRERGEVEVWWECLKRL